MQPEIRFAPLFSSLDDTQLQRVLESSHVQDLRDGQPLFTAGAPARNPCPMTAPRQVGG